MSNNLNRIEREREFHNRRFSSDQKNISSRSSQEKYYYCVKVGAKKYLDRVTSLSQNADVLEYGCGDVDNYKFLAPIAKSFTAIDISDAAIERLQRSQVHQNARFLVMDAMNLEFPDNSFDIVFGAGILHHLDTSKSAKEILRVLKPNGVAVFWEPMGYNPVINLYRYVTPSARTPDEHPFIIQDFEILEKSFSRVTVQMFGFTSILSVPFRGSPVGDWLLRFFNRIDQLLFKLPGMKYLGWFSLIYCSKS